MAAQNFLHFRLDGIEYKVQGDMERERMEKIVNAVEGKVKEIRHLAPYYSKARAATLAALQLSEELMDIKDEYVAFANEAGVDTDTLY